MGRVVFFTADDGVHGRELWITDGTETGTRLVRDIYPGSDYSDPDDLTALDGGRVLFTAYSPATGRALWVSDGTETGTHVVNGVHPASKSGDGTGIQPLGDGRAVFVASESETGHELWVTDGTTDGTRLVKDIHQLTAAEEASGMYEDISTGPRLIGSAADGRVFFLADDRVHGREIWVTDGTEDNTRMLSDANPGTGGVLVNDWCIDGNKLIVALETSAGDAVWSFSTSGAASKLLDESVYNISRIPGGFYELSGGSTTWISDGTPGGTVEREETGTVHETTRSGVELYGTSMDLDGNPGTPDEAVLVMDDGTGPRVLLEGAYTIHHSAYFGLDGLFLVLSQGEGRDLYRFDGASLDFVKADVNQVSLTFMDGDTEYYLVKPAEASPGISELWRADSTSGSAAHVTDVDKDFGWWSEELAQWDLTKVGDGLFYDARGSASTLTDEPWVLDVNAGTYQPLGDINPGAAGSYPGQFVAADAAAPSGSAPVSTLFEELVSLEAASVAFDLDDYFTDPNGGALTFEVTGVPAGVEVNTITNVVVADEHVAAGDYTVTVTASAASGPETEATFDWTVVDTGKLLIKSDAGWERDATTGAITSEAGAVITVGRKDGLGKLFRIEGVDAATPAAVTVHDGKLIVKGRIFSEQVATDKPLMQGAFTVDMDAVTVTGFTDDDIAGDHRLVGDLVNPRFTEMAIGTDHIAFRTDVSFGSDFAALTSDGAPLQFTFGKDGLVLGSSGGEVSWLPTNFELDLPGASGMALGFSNLGAFYEGVTDSLYLQGKAELTWTGALDKQFSHAIDAGEKAGFFLDLYGEDSSASPYLKGDKFIRLTSTAAGIDWDVVGEISYADEASGNVDPGTVGLRSMKLTLDTIKDAFGGELVVTVPWAMKGIDVGAGLTAVWSPTPGLDALSLILGGLNAPLGATGIFVQGGKLALEGLADTGTGDKLHSYTLDIDGTFGPDTAISPSPVKGKIAGKITEGMSGGDVKLDLDAALEVESKVGDFTPAAIDAVTGRLSSWFGLDISEIEDFQLAEAKADLKMDFSTDNYTVNGSFKALDGALSGTAMMNAFWDYSADGDGVPGDFNLNSTLSGTVSLPASIPLIGGKTLAGGRGAWIQSFDGDDTNDSISIWTSVSTLFGSINAGLRVTLDGDIGLIGKKDIVRVSSLETSGSLGPVDLPAKTMASATTSGWTLDESLGLVVLSAEWENPDDGARLELIAPDGTVISEGEFASYGGLDLIEDLNDTTSRHVALQAPEAGMWDLRLTSVAGLGTVEYLASEILEEPTASFENVTIDKAAGEVVVRLDADIGDAADAQVFFFAAKEGGALAGLDLGEARLVATDTGLEARLALSALPAGEYHLGARIEADGAVPVVVTHETPISVEGGADLSVTMRKSLHGASGTPILVVEVSNLGTMSVNAGRLVVTVADEMVGAGAVAAVGAVGLSASRSTFDLDPLAPGASQVLRFALPEGAADLPDPILVDVQAGVFDSNLFNNPVEAAFAALESEVTPPTEESLIGINVAFGSTEVVSGAMRSYQVHPQIEALSNGGHVVVWAGDGAGDVDYDVYARMFDAEGVAVGGEFGLDSTPQEMQFSPSVATLSNGNWVAVYESINDDQDAFMGQIFTADGTRVGDEFRVSPAMTYWPNDAKVSALKGGGFAVTWSGHASEDSVLEDIQVRLFSGDGVALGDAMTISQGAVNDEDLPEIQALTGGGFAVAWEAGDSAVDGDNRILVSVFDSAGTALVTRAQANIGAGDPSDAAVGSLADGGFVVVWSGQHLGTYTREIVGQRFDADGGKVGGNFVVCQEGTINNAPAIVGTPDGGIVVVWERVKGDDGHGSYDTDSDIVMQRFDADLEKVGDETRVNAINPLNQNDPDVAVLKNGTVAVTWQSVYEYDPAPDRGPDIMQQLFEARHIGTEGGEKLRGTVFDDTMLGRGGNDKLIAGKGDDVLDGGAGNDKLRGGRGDDVLEGGSGNDKLAGGKGLDLVRFTGKTPVTVDLALKGPQDTGHGKDTFKGIEAIQSDAGRDVLSGGNKDDYFFGMGGKDVLSGRGGDDYLDGGRGRDRLFGGEGDDYLVGGRAGDRLYGGNGADLLNGGGGKDRLFGGAGDDVLHGGKGRDVFEFSGDFGADTVADFSGRDVIRFVTGNGEAESFGEFLSFSYESAGSVIYDKGFDGEQVIELFDITLADLDALDFIFV